MKKKGWWPEHRQLEPDPDMAAPVRRIARRPLTVLFAFEVPPRFIVWPRHQSSHSATVADQAFERVRFANRVVQATRRLGDGDDEDEI